MKEKIFNKGYTLRVHSWENDGDYSAIKTFTVDSLEEAKELKKLVEFSKYKSPSEISGLGNANDEDYLDYKPKIVKEMKKFKHLEYVKDAETDDDYFDAWAEYNLELLGSSEWYLSRVCEKAEILYAPEDIYIEKIA